MNPNIDAELQQLKAYLAQYPHEAVQLAVNHLEDYLALLNECQRLKDQIRQLRQSDRFKVSPTYSLDTQLTNGHPQAPPLLGGERVTLEQKLKVEILKRNLASELNYNQAKFWAVEYFKFFLHLNESYLEKRAELISLTNKPSLPYFL